MRVVRVVPARLDHLYRPANREDNVWWREEVPPLSVADTNHTDDLPSASGCANSIISPGRISGIPPTRVLTMNRPAHAASMMLIPNASVSEVER